ncbi:methyltransferase domain-containing protein [Actinomadura madurae]|uniref:methyltransferase domain-containing protein n=1 Tax=Actinomadura madurae TaxID=1993 RepID=UPI0020D218AA|nr:methyltransferase domain-containing protein [Actinomadura madurae]MCQ0007729.1 methyltransferase domain-containing protein [Actinomadura madurae]
MSANDTYTVLDTARRLHMLGDWDHAAALLAGERSTEALELRAEILYERFLFRLDGIDAAAGAIAALDPESPRARLLAARLAYTRLVFKLDPLPEDYETAESGYRSASADPATHGWAEFHWGALLDNVRDDGDAAKAHYTEALQAAHREGDPILESIVLRHLAWRVIEDGDRDEGLRILRRSLHLRSAAACVRRSPRPSSCSPPSCPAMILSAPLSSRPPGPPPTNWASAGFGPASISSPPDTRPEGRPDTRSRGPVAERRHAVLLALPALVALDFKSPLSRSMTRMSNETIEALIPQLDAVDASPGAAELRARSYELLRSAPGSLTVDVGCGAGRAVAELADQGVRVMGIDVDDQMIALARKRRPDGEFRVGDAYALPLGDGEASGYRADKVVHTLADPGRALAEAHRVLTQGGRVVLCGQDWDTFAIDSADPEVTRTIVQKRADLVASPRAARRYRNLLLDARLPRRDGRGAHGGVHRRLVPAGPHPPRRDLPRARRDHARAGRNMDRRPAGTRPDRPAVRSRTDLHGGGDPPLRG